MGYGKNNKLFWDGAIGIVEKIAEYNINTEYMIKKAYLEGALDGRLFSQKHGIRTKASLMISFQKQ